MDLSHFSGNFLGKWFLFFTCLKENYGATSKELYTASLIFNWQQICKPHQIHFEFAGFFILKS